MMKHEVLRITVDYAKAGLQVSADPKLITYILDTGYDGGEKKRRPAMVICPGGAYSMTSDREAEPIAVRFNALGFHSFVVRYTVEAPMRFPGALLEVCKAIAMVREHADEWNVDSNKIVVCGFSAGGHLAASVGTFWNNELVTKPLGLNHQEDQPNGMVLCYPVITSGGFAHNGSFYNLLRDHYEEQKELVSLEKQVNADTPPAFLWHTFEDSCVPVENTLLMATALREKRIPFEVHIYPKGWHGLALSTQETGGGPAEVSEWPDLAARWAKNL